MKSTDTIASRNSSVLVLRVLLFAAGFAAALAAFQPFLLSLPGKMPALHSWWFVMVACGLVMTAAATGTRWFWAGLAAAALLVGTSAQLALTDRNVFEFINIRPTSNYSYLILISIVIQVFVTAAALLRTGNGALGAALRCLNALGRARTMLLFALIVGFLVSVMRYVGSHDYVAYLQQLVLTAGFLLLNIATTWAMAASAPAHSLDILADRVGNMVSYPGATEKVRKYDRRFPAAVALWTLLATSLICLFAFERIPHVVDEAVYLFQSKYFLQGRISVPAPPVPEAFRIFLVDFVHGDWYSIMPPGWPLVLAIGSALNVPWLVNPVLAAASILLAHAIFCRIAGRGTANLVIALMATSPWFLAMSASLMSHTLTLAASLASWLLLLQARDGRRLSVAVLAGALMGLVFLARFLDGVIVGGLTGLWVLCWFGVRSRWAIAFAYGLGCVLIGALVFPYNQHLTGDPLLTTLTNYFNKIWHVGADGYGFGPNIGPGPGSNWQGELYHGHSPTEALLHTQHNIQSANRDLFGWGIGSLLFVFAHTLWGRWSRNDLFMGTIVVAIIGAFSLFWFSGGYYIGPRYWYLVLVPLVFLSASGMGTLAAKLNAVDGFVHAARRLGFAVTVLCVISMGSFMTWRSVAKYNSYRSFHTDYRELAEKHDLNDSLVLVKFTSLDDYASAFILNAPDLSGHGPIFAKDLGPASNRALARAFPDRRIYFVVGRSSNARKAHIVKGPVSNDTLR